MGYVFSSISYIISQIADEEMEEYPELRKLRLQLAWELLKSVYSDKNQHSASISADFSSAAQRSAYICRYMITHVSMLKKYFDSFLGSEIRQIATKNASLLRVCSIGGGPGSDFLGLLLSVAQDTNIQISGAILDLYPDWKDVFIKVAKRMDPFRKHLKLIDINYYRYDFFQDTVSVHVVEEIQNADVITMVKFVSAVMSDKDLCQRRLKWICSQMKPGAILFCIDNSGGNSINLVNKACENTVGMKFIRQDTKEKFVLPNSENLLSLEVKPLQKAQLAMTLWKKESLMMSLYQALLKLRLQLEMNK